MSYMFASDYEPMLPFKRGLTLRTDRAVDLTSDLEPIVIGKTYTRPNILGPTDMMVTMLAVKNMSGATLTASGAQARMTVKWSGVAGEYGRVIGGVTTAASEWLAGVIGPFYVTSGVDVLNKDVFWLIIGGPCEVRNDTGATLNVGDFIRCSGAVNGKVLVGTPGTHLNCFGVVQTQALVSTNVDCIISVPSISS